jgi:hypothetical protein
MYIKYITYGCLFILLLVIEIRLYCNYLVHTYFNWGTLHTLWKNYINPDKLSYGLWDTTNNTIEKANDNLYSFMHTKADINQHSVLYIGNIKKRKNKTKTKSKNKNKKWDRIIAIETDSTSIPKLANVLQKDGILVCSTLVLKDNTLSSFYLDTISDFLCIPKVSYTEWKNKMEETFTLVELHDSTKNTLNPYYNYLFNSFISKKQLPQWVADILIYYFYSIPFQYVIAVCKPKC